MLNLSIETDFDDPGIKAALSATGSIVIAAAGSDQQNLDEDEVYPAGSPQ